MTSEQPEIPAPLEPEATAAPETSPAAAAPEAPAAQAATENSDEPSPIRVVQNLSELSADEADSIVAKATETRIRHAPKLGAFFFVGAVVGIILGLLLGFWLSDPNMVKRGIYITVSVVFVTTIVELFVGALVVYLDKRSQKAESK
ncbi:hypothetical protein V5R04_15130 [Jonesiaceae bacterium BS-20]|uniref:Uncharacterized protein n=1 Tax=Jonesiaceae bacterium BS-20 TaxID=3120821 RepID=A0AAU7DW61_9MICO